LPGVQFVNFTEPMIEIRLVKSDAEVAFLEKAQAIVDAGYQAALAAAKPGAPDYAVWGAAMGEICSRGSEIPVHQHWIGGFEPEFTLTRPVHAPIEEGWMFLSELEACWGGYHAQGDQPFSCGQPRPMWLDLMKYAVDLWKETFPHLRPGVTVRELQDRVDADARRLAPKSGRVAGASGTLLMHGRGLGSDAPLITGQAGKRDMDRVLAAGWCFVYKPTVKFEKYSLCWGDTVAITPSGPQRLGNAPQELLIADGGKAVVRG